LINISILQTMWKKYLSYIYDKYKFSVNIKFNLSGILSN
jgi:hypothetical protein